MTHMKTINIFIGWHKSTCYWKVLPFWGYMTRKPRQGSCLSSCMFCFPANAKSQGCLITKQTQRRWSWNVCGCPCVFLGKSMVSPLVPWGWWSDSAWLFLSHLQECVRCHFGPAKQCWMPVQTKLLAMGTVEVLMREAWGRGCESSQWQKHPWGVCLCLCPSLSTPILHLCWAPVEPVPSAKPRAGRGVLHSGVLGELKHLQPHCLLTRETTAAALLSPSCHLPAHLQLAAIDLCWALLGSLCPGGWHAWAKILYEMDSYVSWTWGLQNL